MATTVTKELLYLSDPYYEILPGSSVYVRRIGGTGVDNVGNYNISNTNVPLANYVQIEGPPIFGDTNLSLGFKLQDRSELPTNLTITGVSTRAVFEQTALNIGAPWHNAKTFILNGSDSSITAEYVGASPTRLPWTVAWSNAFSTQPSGASWTRSAIFDSYYGLSLLEPTGGAGGSGSLELTLAALTVLVSFELPTITPVTSAAINIRRTRADLQGSIDPLGATSAYPVTCWFQYNKTGTFATTDPVTSSVVLTGSGTQQITIRQTGLTAGAVYAYRLVARNGAGDLFYGNTYLVALPMVDDVIMRF